MSGPLQGLSVVDFSRDMAGALATMLLADNVASVIKVEPPGGDPFRRNPPMVVWNRGKKSIILDLRKPQASEVVSRLLDGADILVESYRPGVSARLGIDYASLKDRYPHLVYCSISGYGQEGSDRDRRGHDGLVQARMGLQWLQEGHRKGPIYMGFAFPAYSAAFTATYGILAALHVRARTGLGQHVDASLRSGTVIMNRWAWAEKAPEAPELPRLEMTRMFKCGDGEYLWTHTGARASLERLLRLLGLAEFMTDQGEVRVDTITTRETWARLNQRAEAIFASRPRAHWIELLDAADVPNRPVLYAGDAFEDEQVKAIGAVATVHDPVLGPLKEVAPPFRFEITPTTVPGPAPRPGEHTLEVLAGLGFNDGEIQSLQDAGAVQVHPAGPRQIPSPAKHHVAESPAERKNPKRQPPMKHPLEDMSIVEFGMWLASPVATRLCADLGARVIKVEPLDGDPLRPQHQTPDIFYKSFHQSSAGKRGIALNLKSPEGQAIAHSLIAKADVVAHNYRPGVDQRLGVDYAVAKELNPQVIYCFSPGYGSTGPRRDKPGFEPLYSAFCGVHRNSGGKGNPPSRSTSFDQFCGLLAANAILMSLCHRDRTGEGQYIEVPQLAQVLYYTSEVFFTANDTMPSDPMLDVDQTGYGPLNRLYRTRDDWVCVCCWRESEWEALCRALDREELLREADYDTMENRFRHGEALASTLGQRFLCESTLEWSRRLESCGVPFEIPIMDGEDMALMNPEYLECGLVAEYEHPHWGRVRAPGIGVGLSMTPGINQGPPPLLGQHTKEVLAELGYSGRESEALRRDGVVTWPDPPGDS